MRSTAKFVLALVLLFLPEGVLLAEHVGQASSRAPQTVKLSGRVVADDGRPITAGRVTVNQNRSATVIDGAYSLTVDRGALYEIRYEGDQVYPFLQTYDDGEVADLGGRLPPVELVARKPGRMLLAFGGDVMMGRRFYKPNPGEPQWIHTGHELEDGKALLQHIKDYVELADFSSVNLETQLIPFEPKVKAKKAYTFYSHPATLGALAWAGVDYVTLGNNHVYDYLEPGLESTLAAFEQYPLAHSGSGVNAEQAQTAHRTTIAGNDLSYLSFVGWKGHSTPSQVAEGTTKGGGALGTKPNIVAAVEREAALNRVIVLQYHGGIEYADAPTDEVRDRLKAAIDHGADLAIAHHPHVLQGMEVYQGKLIAYSMGNFLFDQYRQETQSSALLYVWMDGAMFHRAEIVPIYIKDYHTLPATGEMRDYVLRRLAHQSAGYGTVLGASGGHGVIQPPGQSPDEPLVDTAASQTLKLDAQTATRLPTHWDQPPPVIEPLQPNVTYHLGKDLLLWGDNEQHRLFGLSEDNWAFSSKGSGITDAASRSGRYALELAPADDAQPSTAEQRYFLRKFDADKPLSLVGYAMSSGPAELSVCLDYWPAGMSLAQATKTRPGACLPKIAISKGRWTQFQLDVPPLGDAISGIRVRLQNDSSDGSGAAIFVDDLALVSWEAEEHRLDQSGRLDDPDDCDYIEAGDISPHGPASDP
jgi:poly-gamma-glutamate capsule biosynthesis protein CapA/YwtB (metallophosphatase superfamily)